jgi:hypothetical protein
MDPLGFALEHFDAIGQWRETDGGAEINATITLAGETIDSPAQFREGLLTHHGGEFVRTVVEKLLSYALGRELGYQDAPIVRHLVREVGRSEYPWSTLILGIVKSEPFQTSRGSDDPRSIAHR